MMDREIGEEFYLDLHKTELWGWETTKSDLIVATIIEGIKLGCDFPSVEVVRGGGNIYELVCGNNPEKSWWEYGGHHRAVAHYIEEIPLKCSLHDRHRNNTSGCSFISVKNITLGAYTCSSSQLLNNLKQLPMNVAIKFCAENNLDIDRYLPQ